MTVGRRGFAVDDPFFDDGNFARAHVRAIESTYIDSIAPNPASRSFSCSISGCSFVWSSRGQYERHYECVHRNSCSVCRCVFPTPRLLDIHILEEHGAFFHVLSERQPMVCQHLASHNLV